MGCHAQVVSVKMGPRYQQQRKQCLGLDVAGVGKSFETTYFPDTTILSSSPDKGWLTTSWYLVELTRRKEYRAMVRCFLSELPQSTEANTEQLTTYCHRAATTNTTLTASPPLPNPTITTPAARSVSVWGLGAWSQFDGINKFILCNVHITSIVSLAKYLNSSLQAVTP